MSNHIAPTKKCFTVKKLNTERYKSFDLARGIYFISIKYFLLNWSAAV